MKRIMTTVLSAAMLSALGACGGGGDNSVPFTTVQDIRPSTTVRFVGSSQGITATSNGGVVTDFESGTRAWLTYNEVGELTGLTARSAKGAEVTFTESEIEQPGESGFYTAEKEDESAVGFAASALTLGWSYQSFGVWLIGTSPSEELVLQTVGAISPPSGVPMTGTATYEGLSAGIYIESEDVVFVTASDVEAVADFAGLSIEFETTGTEVGDDLGSVTEMPGLDMTGTLTYEAGRNQFTGTVTTTGGMTGTANGLFYGPAAQEIGGTFITQGASYIGAFGAA